MSSELKFQLYCLSNFYVEIQSRRSDCRILQILAFSDGVLLAPYLERIDISKLFNSE